MEERGVRVGRARRIRRDVVVELREDELVVTGPHERHDAPLADDLAAEHISIEGRRASEVFHRDRDVEETPRFNSDH